MTTVKNGTKKAEWIIGTYITYDGYNLWDVYGNYSHAKANAWERCRMLCYDENGYNFHISSHNSNVFTVSWETETAYRVETAYNSYILYK